MKVTTNPTHHYPKQEVVNGIEEILPLLSYLQSEDEPIRAQVERGYACSAGCPPIEIEGGTVGHDGVYRYPDDPELHPYLRVDLQGESPGTLFLYPYAIAVIRDKDRPDYVTRLD